MLEPWVAQSYCPVCCPGLSTCQCGSTQSVSCHLATRALHPRCHSAPLLLVWMNVSSLIPWLLDFHAVWLSVSSGCFLFLNLLVSFFWLCEEAQCVSILIWSPKKQIFLKQDTKNTNTKEKHRYIWKILKIKNFWSSKLIDIANNHFTLTNDSGIWLGSAGQVCCSTDAGWCWVTWVLSVLALR